MSLPGSYRPRPPESTPFYQCLQDYWDEFKESYPYFYEPEYGPLRPVVEKTVVASWSVASCAMVLPASSVSNVPTRRC